MEVRSIRVATLRRVQGWLAFLALCLTPALVLAQRDTPMEPAPPVEIPPGGSELLRALLDRAGVKPLSQDEIWAGGQTSDVIVIILGDPNKGDFQPLDYARRVLTGGGAALIATDTPLQMGDWFNWGFLANIVSYRVKTEDDNATHAAGAWRKFCPYVVPIEANEKNGDGPPANSPLAALFAGLNRIATNNSAFLMMNAFEGEMRYPLARFPAKSVAFQPQTGVQRAMPPNAFFAVGGDGTQERGWRRYRFLALADHSVFINQMLIEPGTQNLEFTYRTIDFLTGKGTDDRRRCLFVEDGEVIEEFDGLRKAFTPPPPQLPTPNLGAIQDKLTDMGNALVSDLQQRNIFNTLLDKLFGLPVIVRFFLIIGVLYATWFLLRRFFAARKPTDVPSPPPVAGVPSGPPGVFERRRKELILRNNVYEPVRDTVREFFASIGIHGEQASKPPKLVISDEVRKPDSLRDAVKDFWKLAFGPPQKITLNRWAELEPYVERLRAAHAAGKWRFVEQSDTPT